MMQQQNIYEQPIYHQPMAAPAAGVVVTQTTVQNKSSMRQAIPAFPMPLAVILAIVNFLLPGFGTIFAGFGVLCCGNTDQSGGGRVGTFCINFWVGILQLLTAWLIIGWVWSIIWGIAFIASAGEEGRTTTTTTTAVVGPPVAQPVLYHTHSLPT
ncbi:protein SPEC3-like [Styela clava]